MLEQARGLSERALAAIAELERDVVEADGGRLKLEWGQLRRDGGERWLWWEGERLLGFLGLYAFGAWTELAGMVAPAARRRGIATALLDAAGPVLRSGGYEQALLIVPRSSAAGQRLALRRGAVFDHSEHALVMHRPPSGRCSASEVALRPATPDDLPVVSHLLEVGFGVPAPDWIIRTDSPTERTLVIELRGGPVGTLRMTRDGERGGIYGFVIDPVWQGRGLGREALRAACEQLRADGARQIGLEVAVENERALTLYTSLGFEAVTTEDYYALALADPRAEPHGIRARHHPRP